VGDLRRLIAFDLDGTLVDSRRDLADSANALIVELGGTPLNDDAVARMIGEGAAMLVARALAGAGIHYDLHEALARFLDIYDTRLLNHTRAYPGIEDAVRHARTLGRVVVLTNKPKRPSEAILDGLDLRGLFDDVVGGDGPLPRKPDPASLLKLMEGAAADGASTLMIGDSAIDHETALRAGTRCCLVSFGFGFETFPHERLTGREWIAPDGPSMLKVLDEFAGHGRANGSS
jgi:phosphoglycolate phosphatase